MTTIIAVDAGGRLFRTTRDTLLMSGSKYFEALFGNWNSVLNEESECCGQEASASASTTKEIFIDRNPDLFADVLDFMRSARLPPKIRRDADKLEQLQGEAEFFILDSLSDACKKAQEELEYAKPWAECGFLRLSGAKDDQVRPRYVWHDIIVPKGKVLFLDSATLCGNCRLKHEIIQPFTPKGPMSTCTVTRKGKAPFYDEGYETPDFALWVDNCVDRSFTCVAHVGIELFSLDQFGTTGDKNNIDIDFRRKLGIVLKSHKDASEELLRFSATGAADWHIVYWVGDAAEIPGLMGRSADSGGTASVSKSLT